MFDRATNWLETKWVTPAYAGWLLMGLTICFFGVATNTMAGWLYVLSGVGIALLGVAAILPARSLQSLTIDRQPVQPVTAGAELEITVTIQNPTDRVQSLFQVQDLAPFRAKHPPIAAVDRIAPRSEYQWVYRQLTERRGVYEWERLVLRSGAPIGLFWCRRDRQARAIAYVYPQVLELSNCPLLEGMGSSELSTNRPTASRYLELANEGVTRSLRPYRYGDSMRMIHWRTSARRGEFQVRELEIERGGQDIIIGLDSNSGSWDAENFEQAVIAACSLYFYAVKFPNLNVKLFTPQTGAISGERRVLETLAEIQIDTSIATDRPNAPMVLLTSQLDRFDNLLSTGDRWIFWSQAPFTPRTQLPGITIDPHQSLQKQLSSNNPTKIDNTTDLSFPLNPQNSYLN
jgi:uncharacterized protein (DUF58 family)